MNPRKFIRLTESAACPEIGTKVRTETFTDHCCPHCDYVFPEKGGPWPKDRTQLENRTPFHEVVWACSQCKGEMHYPESDRADSFFGISSP